MAGQKKMGHKKLYDNRKDRQFRPYAVYALSLVIFGTNGILASHISLGNSQIVLMRTLIGGMMLTCLVLLKGGFDKRNLHREWRPLLLGGALLGELSNRSN